MTKYSILQGLVKFISLRILLQNTVFLADDVNLFGNVSQASVLIQDERKHMLY